MDEERDPPEQGRDPEPRPPRALYALRLGVPLALAAVGYSVLVAERWSVDDELQVVAPDAVRPGDPIPVRAFVFGDVDDPRGGGLVDAPIEIELRDAERVLARASLALSPTHTSEGSLSARTEPAELVLRAIARDASGAVVATVERPIAIAADAPRQELSGRLAGELAHLDVGAPIVEAPGALAPHVDVRVVSGTCVPEETCSLLVATDADEVAVTETAALSQTAVVREGSLRRLDVVVHGPEVLAELVLSRAGAPLARVPLRLPVALATAWLDARIDGDVIVEAHPPPGRDALVLDVYRDGRWIDTRTIDRTARIPAGEGLLRLQAHADPFGASYSAVRLVTSGDPRALLAAEGAEPADPVGTDPRLVLAGAEEEVRALPSASSGLEADRTRLADRRRRIWVFGGIALVLGIAVFAATLLRRGLGAAAEARDVMREAGDEAASTRATRVRMTISVLALVGGVALALLAGATIILARAALVVP